MLQIFQKNNKLNSKKNSAINILEQQIKANAEVSSQANNIAIKTSNIANTIVDTANQKSLKEKKRFKSNSPLEN